MVPKTGPLHGTSGAENRAIATDQSGTENRAISSIPLGGRVGGDLAEEHTPDLPPPLKQEKKEQGGPPRKKRPQEVSRAELEATYAAKRDIPPSGNGQAAAPAIDMEIGEPGRMAANGYAISHSPEDRRPGPTCRVTIREIRRPAISAGPNDNLDDFVAF